MKNVPRLMLTLIIALTVCAALLVQVAGVGAKNDSENARRGGKTNRASSTISQEFTALRPASTLAVYTRSSTTQDAFGLPEERDAPLSSTVQTFIVNGNRVGGNELFVANLQIGDRVFIDNISGQINFITDMPQPTCGDIGTPNTVNANGLARSTYESNGNALCYNSDKLYVDPLTNSNQGHAGLFLKRNSTRAFVGQAGYDFMAGGNENFSLGINDGNGGNNSGSFSVRVIITRAISTPVFVPGNAIVNNEKFVANLVAGDQVFINSVSGTVDFHTNPDRLCLPPEYIVDANGLTVDYSFFGSLCYVPDSVCNDPLPGPPDPLGFPKALHHAGLLMKRNNTRTFIGKTGASFTANGNETLSLGINDCPATNNSGGFDATVIISRINPVLSISDVTVTEGNSGTVTAAFTVTLTPDSTEDVTVNYATSNGTAIAGQDYAAASGPLTFSPGQTSKTININVNGDTLDEANESFNVNLSNESNASIADAQGVCTIVDNDVAGTFSFTQAAYNVIENPSGGTVTVQRTGGTSGTVTINYATSNGTAIAGSDYTATQGTLTFNDGEIYKNVFVPLFNDTLDESNETFSVTLSNPTGGATLGSPGTILVTIVDNDIAPTISINDVSVTEGNSGFVTAVFTVRLSFAFVSAVTVHYKTASGTATSGTDFGAEENTLTISPGATSHTLAVKVIGDNVVEPNEIFYMNLTAPFNATLLDGQGVGTINNNDVGGALKLSAAAYSVNEGASLPITVQRTGGTSGTVTVQYATSNGTAAAGADYTAMSGTLTFANGETSKSFNISVPDDLLDETNETFNLSLSNPTGGATLTSPSTAVVTINDNDPTPGLSINNVTLNEGSAGTANAVFTVSLSAASGQTVTVNYAIANVTAAAGTDYQSASGVLTFAPGVTTRPITVLVNGDITIEPNETFNVNLTNPANATLTDGQGAGTITNDDVATTMQLGASAYSVNENGGNAVVTVSRTGGTSGAVTVQYATSNGTAAAGADYTASSGTLSFAAGQTSKTFNVPILDDAPDEANETFNVALSNPTGGATLGSPSTAVLTINDNDPTPSLKIAPASVVEGHTGTVNAVFNVTLSAASSQTVTVSFATANGSATAASDYAAVSGALTFSPGQTSKTINVAINGDTSDRVNETFNVNLSNPANATVAVGQALGIIIDDDSTSGDFDGDRKTDYAVFTPSNGQWKVIRSSDSTLVTQVWGVANSDKPVPGDYDGDGKTDYAVFRTSTTIWYILQSSNGAQRSQLWGLADDKLVPGDYDGDGKTDVAVYRPSNGTWYILQSSTGTLRSEQFGTSEDKPVQADYDGDGKMDVAVFRPSDATWYIKQSLTATLRTQPFGLGGDKPVQGDYDRDGKADIALFRPVDGTWYILKSSNNGVQTQLWGANGDTPQPGDYDRDGKNDFTVWRSTMGVWYVLRSSDGTNTSQPLGTSGDVPVSAPYVIE